MQDIFAELECMAATHSGLSDDLEEAIMRWQHIFGYFPEQAENMILEQRDDLTSLVPEELWEAVREQQEFAGHDRESYSHWLRLMQKQQSKPPTRSVAKEQMKHAMDFSREYLVRLEGPISSVDVIQTLAGLNFTPKVLQGTTEDDDQNAAQFCRVDGLAKEKLTKWIEAEAPAFRPLFVSQSMALKDLCAHTTAPRLGIDASSPQNRLDSQNDIPRPQQNEYPVQYFFYGTLADAEVLRRLFHSLDSDRTEYSLRPASVTGGRLALWNGKYKALLDAQSSKAEVHGHRFEVQSKEHEDILRSYETEAYEVVRCHIVDADGSGVEGCTFRFRNEDLTT